MTKGIRIPRSPKLLEHPHHRYPPAGWTSGLLTLRVWTYPSHQALRSWAIVVNEGKHLLRRVVWEIEIDRDARVAKEKLDTTQIVVPSNLHYDLLGDLSGISFAAFAQESAGLDGTRSGIEIHTLAGTTILDWWEKTPVGWEHVVQWRSRVEQIFESMLPPIPERFYIGYRSGA